MFKYFLNKATNMAAKVGDFHIKPPQNFLERIDSISVRRKNSVQ